MGLTVLLMTLSISRSLVFSVKQAGDAVREKIKHVFTLMLNSINYITFSRYPNEDNESNRHEQKSNDTQVL